jgi:hypothetical protein
MRANSARARRREKPARHRHRIRVALQRGPTDAIGPYQALAEELEEAFPAAYDGWGTDDATVYDIYFYCDDADELWAQVRPAVAGSPLVGGGRVYLRRGPCAHEDESAIT